MDLIYEFNYKVMDVVASLQNFSIYDQAVDNDCGFIIRKSLQRVFVKKGESSKCSNGLLHQ